MTIKIENKTPWNTGDLEKLLLPLLEGTSVKDVIVDLRRAQPGVKRDEQQLVYISSGNYGVPITDRMLLDILSPKRAQSRSEMLSRLSLAGDVQPHEAVLPEEVAGTILHAIDAIKNPAKYGSNPYGRYDWEFNKHTRGDCSCPKPVDRELPVVRGDTRVKTEDSPDIERLERKLEWAEKDAQKYRERMEKAQAQADRLKVRIEKLRAKEWKAKGDGR